MCLSSGLTATAYAPSNPRARAQFSTGSSSLNSGGSCDTQPCSPDSCEKLDDAWPRAAPGVASISSIRERSTGRRMPAHPLTGAGGRLPARRAVDPPGAEVEAAAAVRRTPVGVALEDAVGEAQVGAHP